MKLDKFKEQASTLYIKRQMGIEQMLDEADERMRRYENNRREIKLRIGKSEAVQSLRNYLIEPTADDVAMVNVTPERNWYLSR